MKKKGSSNFLPWVSGLAILICALTAMLTLYNGATREGFLQTLTGAGLTLIGIT